MSVASESEGVAIPEAHTDGRVDSEPSDFFPSLLSNWQQRVRANQVFHEKAASRLGRMNYWLGIPAAIASAIVGTSVFASLDKQVGIWPKIAVGLISVSVGVITALQTFLRFAERSEKHHNSAASLGALHRKIELLLALPVPELDEAKRTLFEIEEKMSAIQAAAPVILDDEHSGPPSLRIVDLVSKMSETLMMAR